MFIVCKWICVLTEAIENRYLKVSKVPVMEPKSLRSPNTVIMSSHTTCKLWVKLLLLLRSCVE
jgi:hypothetical protein